MEIVLVEMCGDVSRGNARILRLRLGYYCFGNIQERWTVVHVHATKFRDKLILYNLER